MLKQLWDQFSDTLGTTIFHPQYFAKKYAREAVEEAARQARGNILDIGCGRAPYRHLFTGFTGAQSSPRSGSGYKVALRYVTLDHPQVAKRYFKDFKPDILADVSQGIPVKDRSFDTVLLLMVVEHLPNPATVLKEVRRILKPGGKVIISTVQTYPIHDEPYDFFRYTKYGLRSLLQEVGFKVTKIEVRGNLFTTTAANLNTGIYQIIKQLTRNILLLPVALLLGLIFLPISWFNNFCAYVLSPLDTLGRYRHSLWVVASK